MSFKSIFVMAAVTAFGIALAQPPGDFGRMNQHTKLVAKFDKDGDGKLNAAERKAARASLANQGGRRERGFGNSMGPGGPGLKLRPSDVKTYTTESLYDPKVLRTIFLQFEDPDWEQEMADFYHTDVDVPAKMTVDGKVYPEVGVHFRGASSFMMVPAGRKRSLSISTTYSDPNQRLLSYKSMDLLNAAGDPIFLRTVLYMQMARAYIPAPKANYMRVVINGESWGVYANSQEFNADLIQEAFGSRKGARWKVPGNPSAQGGLAYLGDNPESYKQHYEIKTKDDPKSWNDLIHLCKVLSETPAVKLEQALTGLLDVDETLKFLALDKAAINNDGYWVRMSDYSIYEDAQGKFSMLPHDANETLRETEGGFGGGGGARTVELDPFAGSEDPRKALLNKLLAVPSFRIKYLADLKDIAQNWLDWKKVEPFVTQYQSLIAADVKSDTHKLFTYEQFTNNILKDDPNPGQGPIAGPTIGLKHFFDQRRAYLLNYPDIKKLATK